MGGHAFQARRALNLAALTAEAVPFHKCTNPRVFPQPVKSCPSQNTQ